MNNPRQFPIERNRYFYGKLLTVRDFEVEQRYHCTKRELLNRLLHGAGVVCGLGVTASDESTLMIESGMALDYQGRELLLPEAIFRKLQMLDGQETLADKKDAYLCMSYAEEDIEPVNATGAETDTDRQFDLTRETCRLFLTTEPPAYQQLLEASGLENVSVLYQSDDLILILSLPSAVCAGREFKAQIMVVKNEKTQPVQFSLEGENTFVESEAGRLKLEYRESQEEKRCVYTVPFPMRAKALSDVRSQLFPSGAELNVQLGAHHYKNYLTVEAGVLLCGDMQSFDAYRRRTDDLNRHLRGQELPLYLAKLELIHSSGGVFVGGVTNLPFEQALAPETLPQNEKSGDFKVTTSVRSLEYWQKPDVKAVYQPSSGGLHLDFGIPSPEQYDYSVAHGVVDIAVPGGIYVNSRVFSQEIPHGLGTGAVDVRVAVEFPDGDDLAMLCGNSEVFKSKNSGVTPPWVEVAAVVYPQKGTMRIGLWLHDTVSGNLVRVHYFAQKPERDTELILSQRKVSIAVKPEFSRVKCRGKLQFQADVVGAEDKNVLWSIKEENGGVIDKNGMYQAPELPGTYEITATASADAAAHVSAFVIVE